MRETSRLKIVHSEPAEKENFIKEVKSPATVEEVTIEEEIEEEFEEIEDFEETAPLEMDEERLEALKDLAAQLLELREMLKINKSEPRKEDIKDAKLKKSFSDLRIFSRQFKI